MTGAFPAVVVLRRGWARAVARPWNDDNIDAAIRLERGTHTFLRAASEAVGATIAGSIYSPALYRTSRRPWVKAGYEPHRSLDIMERSLAGTDGASTGSVTEIAADRVTGLASLDNESFEGFWRIGTLGLAESVAATPNSVVLTVWDSAPIGYAIVGAQFGNAFLQRIAVHPDHRGQGHGSALITEAARWAARIGARSLLLNVRRDNNSARSLYERHGFNATGGSLTVMRYAS